MLRIGPTIWTHAPRRAATIPRPSCSADSALSVVVITAQYVSTIMSPPLCLHHCIPPPAHPMPRPPGTAPVVTAGPRCPERRLSAPPTHRSWRPRPDGHYRARRPRVSTHQLGQTRAGRVLASLLGQSRHPPTPSQRHATPCPLNRPSPLHQAEAPQPRPGCAAFRLIITGKEVIGWQLGTIGTRAKPVRDCLRRRPWTPQPSQTCGPDADQNQHGRLGTRQDRRSALVAQGIEQRFPKPCVAGSNPAGGTYSIYTRSACRLSRRFLCGDHGLIDPFRRVGDVG
jgi:hypothetical protein